MHRSIQQSASPLLHLLLASLPWAIRNQSDTMPNPQKVHSIGGQSQDSLDDAEKGMYDRTITLTAPPPFVFANQRRSASLNPVSPVHEGITPCTSVPELALPNPAKGKTSHIEVVEADIKKSVPVKPKISRWILFELWFNVYRRFFTFVVLLNLSGIVLAAIGRFEYAEKHLGALVLGNLLCAILMRNELFIRFLYLVAIYGLRNVSLFSWMLQGKYWQKLTVGTVTCKTSSKFCVAASRWYSLGVCAFRRCVSSFERLRIDKLT